MSLTFNIEEHIDGVIVSVREPGDYGRVALGVLFGSTVAYLVIRSATSGAFQLLICIFIAFGVIKDAISSLRGTDVQLQVRNLDLVSHGHAPDGYNSSRLLQPVWPVPADIHRQVQARDREVVGRNVVFAVPPNGMARHGDRRSIAQGALSSK